MVFFAWVLGVLLRASTALAVTFAPTVVDISVLPGEQASTDFVVENSSDVEKDYLVSLYDVTLNSSLESPEFAPLPQSVSSWVSVDTYAFTLDSGASRVLTLTVAPPATTNDDSVVVGLVIREHAGDNGIAVTSGVTSLVFITVGNPETNAEIVTFAAVPRITDGLHTTFSATVRNGGDRVVQPYGTLQITNTFGGVVEEIDINPSLYRVPTNDEREFTVQSGEEERAGFLHELWREVAQHRVGVFTARLVAAPYPGADATLYATTRFVVLPWRFAVVLLVLGSALTVMWRRNRW